VIRECVAPILAGEKLEAKLLPTKKAAYAALQQSSVAPVNTGRRIQSHVSMADTCTPLKTV